MQGHGVAGEPVGTVFNVQRASFHDGPGIRTTVFLKGCPLHCPWCHNPEGMTSAPQVLVNPARCLSCGACIAACVRAAGPLPAGAVLGSEGCIACARCAHVCPTGGREIAGRRVHVGDLIAEVMRDRLVYAESGGGVTFSGGEPLAQPEFLLACLTACRQLGLHAAVDTCGFAGRELVTAVAGLADLLLWDLKLLDADRHLAVTGAPLAPILANLAAAAAVGIPIWLRIPVIPGVNDDEATIASAATLAATLPSVQRVSLLPYHRTGAGKRSRLGRDDAFAAPPATAERMRALVGVLAGAGVEATIGG